MQKMPSVFVGGIVSGVVDDDLAKVFSTIFSAKCLFSFVSMGDGADTRFAMRYTSIKTKTKTQHVHEIVFNYFSALFGPMHTNTHAQPMTAVITDRSI